MPAYRHANKDFFKTWTPSMAYILGFFAADGCITVNSHGGQYMCLQITDRELLYTIRNTLESEHMIRTRPERKNTYKPLYRLQIGSKEICNDLRALGFTECKTKSLALPSVPQEYLSDFVRGYFDGDGSVWVGSMHKERPTVTTVISVAFTSGSYMFLKKLAHRLHEALSARGSITQRKGKDCWCLRYSVRDSLKLYNFMYNSHVSPNGLFLNRKKAVFEKYRVMRS